MFFITNSRQNKQKERKTGFSVMKQENIGHHRLHEAEEEEALERLSLFFFLSLSVGKKYTLQEGTASDSFCAVYITAFRNRRCSLCCVIIVSIISFHQKGERERSEISLARAPRESSSSAPGRDTKQKNLSLLVLFLFVSKTDS
jgi:hypothetical protein